MLVLPSLQSSTGENTASSKPLMAKCMLLEFIPCVSTKHNWKATIAKPKVSSSVLASSSGCQNWHWPVEGSNKPGTACIEEPVNGRVLQPNQVCGPRKLEV